MTAPKPSAKSAWILYWEKQPGGPAPIAEDFEVVAVLPAQWGKDRVCEVLERLYFERAGSVAELVQWRRSRNAPYQAQTGAYLHRVPVRDLSYYCGHNPILQAYRAQNIRIESEDVITWEEISIDHHEAFCESIGYPACEQARRGPVTTYRRSGRVARDR